MDGLPFLASLEFTNLVKKGDQKFQMRVSPNPMKSQTICHIELLENDHLTLTLTDPNGNQSQLLSKNMSAGAYQIPIYPTRSGLYYLQLKGAKQVETQQIIVEK
jgi:hypothetical protein